jgi:isopenicillin N synthase-like dioxygenase
MEIAVVDLEAYLAGTPGAAKKAVMAVREASEDLGFYFLANHGIAQGLIDRMFEATAAFHALPLESKLALRASDRIVGYLPLGGQTQRTSVHGKSVAPDRSASFYVRAEFPEDHPDRISARPWVFINRWPRELPGFRETALAYFEAMSTLAERLLVLHALALDLPADTLRTHPAFQPPMHNLRLLHYPVRDPALEGQFGIGPHTDYGYGTMLAQAKVPGLEILSATGQWIEAPALPGHLLYNNADMCRRWTNDRFRSAPHRVINRSGEQRYSIPFFIGPRPDVPLECLPTCTDADHPPKYPPLSFGQYLAEINRRNYDLPGAKPPQ